MPKKFATTVAEYYLKLRAKLRPIDSVVDVFNTMEKAKQVLIFLPDKLEDFGTIRLYIPDLKIAFSNSQVTFVMRHNYFTLLEKTDRKSIDILAIKPEHISYFGLASPQLQEMVKKFHFNIVIDLNHDFNLISTHLSFVSHAPLRICLSDKRRDLFYNFQVQASENDRLELKYQKLIRYITLNREYPVNP